MEAKYTGPEMVAPPIKWSIKFEKPTEDDICNDGDDHRVHLTVTILDTVTGLTHTITGGNTYWWTDGNGSCDCNRWPADESGSHCRGDSGVCDGCHRFRVVCVEPLLPGYELEDFNRGYD